MVALPASTAALLFDMDGVLTNTAVVHARAWKETFDAVLRELGRDDTFDAAADYERYVDGRTRLDGVRAFLASRDVELPEGEPDDRPGALTVHGVGARKNDLVLALMREGGVEGYEDARELLQAAHAADVRCAVVSASANAREALRSAGFDAALFDTWVDGVRIAEEGLPGKPAPDTFLTAAADLGVPPNRAVVLEDALAGVEAGRAGGFGCVVGVDRVGHADALREHGADVVVDDLATLELAR